MVGVDAVATSFAAERRCRSSRTMERFTFRDGNWTSAVGTPTVSVAMSAQAAFANLVLSGSFNATSNNVVSMTSVSGVSLVANANTQVTGFGMAFASSTPTPRRRCRRGRVPPAT
jgi:hypothetical protein